MAVMHTMTVIMSEEPLRAQWNYSSIKPALEHVATNPNSQPNCLLFHIHPSHDIMIAAGRKRANWDNNKDLFTV